MTITPDHQSVVRAAVAALDAFGAHSAREATILIGYWCRRDELTPDDVDAVLRRYPDRATDSLPPTPTPYTAASPHRAGDATIGDPGGWTYDRAHDTKTPGGPIPGIIAGYPVGGRR
ncbi:hypothetical protein ACN26Y_17255 [Micromonospora sp. WMMD558]|uniref:hypothetical protein n=1 Tax=Micromonospora sp. WMMD558 TaxID=3403462 RepID=UPI003BF5E65F